MNLKTTLSALLALIATAFSAFAIDDPSITTGIPQTGDNALQLAKRQAYSLAQTANGLGATNTPTVTGLIVTNLTLRGPFHSAVGTLTCTNGTNYALAVTSGSVFKIAGPTGAFVLGGLAAGTEGDRITIVNLVAQNMTIAHENGDATAANRITTTTGSDVSTTSAGAAQFVYIGSGSSGRWVLIASSL